MLTKKVVEVTEEHQQPDRKRESVSVATTFDQMMPALTKTGFIGLSFFLVWALQGSMRTDVAEIRVDLKEHILASDERERANDERDVLLRNIRDITLQQCVNVATTQSKIDACFNAMTRGPVRPTKE